jgi:hypothetical protein
MRRLIPICLALATTLAAPFAAAHEVTPAEKRVLPFTADIPVCGDPAVLEEISARFAEKEAKFWNSGLTLVDYQRITPVAFRPWGLDLIPRRFCSATATTSDGRLHRIDYSIREDLGPLGSTWGTEFCVQGTDRNWAFNPSCRMARP